ncbi:MAG: hypothetical protein WCN92_09660, partial [Eubacteriales bacterium]
SSEHEGYIFDTGFKSGSSGNQKFEHVSIYNFNIDLSNLDIAKYALYKDVPCQKKIISYIKTYIDNNIQSNGDFYEE